MARNTPTPGQKISYFIVILLGVFLLYFDINTKRNNKNIEKTYEITDWHRTHKHQEKVKEIKETINI